MSHYKQFDFPYNDDCVVYNVTLYPGLYLFQAWGASGGGDDQYGKGAYVEGQLSLTYTQTFYISVGGQGKNPSGNSGAPKSCGGGGAGGIGNYYNGRLTFGGFGGGGSSDVRIQKENISSRIFVAAGGGGISGDNLYTTGGDGGGISSEKVICWDNNDFSEGANQSSGFTQFYGQDGKNGEFNIGMGAEGNGGGYFGGYSINRTGLCGGSGGSSFISGHPQCSNMSIIFDNVIMKDGSNTTIKPHPGSNKRDGYILITLLQFKSTGKNHIVLSTICTLLVSTLSPIFAYSV